MSAVSALRLFASALLLAAPVTALGAQAAEQPADEGQEIVVTGEALEEQVRSFVTALTPAPVRGQLGRWEMSVCPVAFGVPDSQRAAIVARMRRVAQASGIRVDREGCRPNVVVVVTDEKRSFMQALRARGLGYFGGLKPSEIERLMETPGPAVAWQTPGPPLSADGIEVGNSGGNERNPEIRTTRPPSRIQAPTRAQFGDAVVIVERRALEGLSTTQLADYAAMRTFARADPARLQQPMPDTILSVLDAPMGSAVPVTLTSWDLSFLRGLYASEGDLYAPSQRGEIGDRMRRQLEQPNEG